MTAFALVHGAWGSGWHWAGVPDGLHPEYLAGLEGPDERGISRWVDSDVYRRVGYDADCDPAVVRERFDRLRGQATAPYAQPCPLDSHPDVPTTYVLCTRDRLCDNGFWAPWVREQLGIEPIELDCGHTPIVSRPAELTAILGAAAG